MPCGLGPTGGGHPILRRGFRSGQEVGAVDHLALPAGSSPFLEVGHMAAPKRVVIVRRAARVVVRRTITTKRTPPRR